MNPRLLKPFAAALALAGASVAFTQDGTGIRLAPEDIKWPSAAAQTGTSFVRGAQMAVLAGAPMKNGLYTVAIKVPPNTKIQPHSHPDERVATVVSGTWYFAYGDKFEEAQLKKLPPGSFYNEPAGGNHFAMTKDEEVVVQLSGVGPTGTKYVNPDDDPRNRPQ
jgi:quercetin dioxygenase-like cupin family protein